MFSRMGDGELARASEGRQAGPEGTGFGACRPPGPVGLAAARRHPVLASLGVKSRALLLWVALGAAPLAGCKSDAAAICEKLDACHLLPKGGPTKTDPDGFQENDCEYQVENELQPSMRAKCADCVDGHACGEIVNACRSVCNPPY
jgi:hypothetical protein